MGKVGKRGKRSARRNRVSQDFSRGKVARRGVASGRGSRGEKFEGSRARCVLPLATPPRDIKSYLRVRYVRTLSIASTAHPCLMARRKELPPRAASPETSLLRFPLPLPLPLSRLLFVNFPSSRPRTLPRLRFRDPRDPPPIPSNKDLSKKETKKEDLRGNARLAFGMDFAIHGR